MLHPFGILQHTYVRCWVGGAGRVDFVHGVVLIFGWALVDFGYVETLEFDDMF